MRILCYRLKGVQMRFEGVMLVDSPSDPRWDEVMAAKTWDGRIRILRVGNGIEAVAKKEGMTLHEFLLAEVVGEKETRSRVQARRDSANTTIEVVQGRITGHEPPEFGVGDHSFVALSPGGGIEYRFVIAVDDPLFRVAMGQLNTRQELVFSLVKVPGQPWRRCTKIQVPANPD